MTRKGKIYFPAWMNVLNFVEDGQTTSGLMKKSEITFSHCFNVVGELLRRGLIKKEKKQGRIVPIKLTRKGVELKQAIIKIKTELNKSSQ